MTTFTMAHAGSDYNGGSGTPAFNVVFTSGDAGDFLVAVTFKRNGTSHTTHGSSDELGSTWDKLFGFDNDISNSNARMSMAVWTRKVVAADETEGTVTVESPQDNATGLIVFQVTPSAAYDWTFQEFAVDGSGAADWDGLSSGDTASVSGSDLFVMSVAAGRRSGSADGTLSFSPQTDDNYEDEITTHGVEWAGAIEANGQSSGVKSATLTAAGSSGVEGVCAVLVFSNGSSGGAGITGTLVDAVDDFIITSSGDTLIDGAANANFDAFTVSTTAELLVGGELSAAISQFQSALTARLEITAGVVTSIGEFTHIADGSVQVGGTTSQSIGEFSLIADADLEIDASASGSLDNFNVSSAASIEISSNANITIDEFVVAGSGGFNDVAVGTLNQSMGTFGVIAQGAVEVDASLISTIPTFVSVSNAEIMISGEAVGGIGDFGISAEGYYGSAIRANLDITVDGFTSTGSGSLGVEGQSGVTISPFISAATAQLDIGAETSITLGDFAAATDAYFGISGSAIKDIGLFSFTGSGLDPANIVDENGLASHINLKIPSSDTIVATAPKSTITHKMGT